MPRHPLVPRGVEDTGRLAHEVLGLAPDPRLAAELQRVTDGNPAAVLGVLADARQRGALRVVGEYAALLPDRRLSLPGDHFLVDRVDELLGRVDELPGRAGELARLLAMAGSRSRANRLTLHQFDYVQQALSEAGHRSAGNGDTVRLMPPALRDALWARVPPWQRARFQSRMLAAHLAERAHAPGCDGLNRDLLELALRATELGQPLDGAADPLADPFADPSATAPGQVAGDRVTGSRVTGSRLTGSAATPSSPASAHRGALAGELLELTDRHPSREAILLEAVRYWAGTGQWARIAALPEYRLTDAVVPHRARAVLLTAGVGSALAELERVGGAPATSGTARLIQAELLALTGNPHKATAVLRAVGVTEPRPFDPDRSPDGGFLADGREACTAWTGGHWDDLLDMAAADRLLGRCAYELCTGEEAAALAAQVQLDRGRPLQALRHLEGCPSPTTQQAPRILLNWARAGVDLVLGRVDAAVALLAETARWQRRTGCDRHLPLVLSRYLQALCAAGRFWEASRVLAELAALTACPVEENDGGGSSTGGALRRTLWLGARIAFARARGHKPGGPLLRDYLRAAEESHAPFALAQARLMVGGETDDPELLAGARRGFGELGATLWELRAEGLLKRLGARPVPAVTAERADQVVAEFVACGLSNASVGDLLLRNEAYVKRRVSRLLLGTNSRSRAQLAVRYAEQIPAALAPSAVPGDVAEWLASGEEAVTVLTGAPGSGRSRLLSRARRRIAADATALFVPGRTPHHGGRFRLASLLLDQLSGRSRPAPHHGAGLAAADALRDRTSPADRSWGRLTMLDSVLGALEDACRRGPVVVLVDDADALDADSSAMLPVFAERARNGEFRLVVVATGRRWASRLLGPARVLSLSPTAGEEAGRSPAASVGGAVAEAATDAAAAAVHGLTEGHPGVLGALHDLAPPGPGDRGPGPYRPQGDRVKGPPQHATDAPRHPLPAWTPQHTACARLFAALPGLRMPAAERVAREWQLPLDTLHGVAERLYAVGSLTVDPAGGLRCVEPVPEQSPAASVDAAAVAAAHRTLAGELLDATLPVDEERLAEHLAGAGAPFGHDRLAGAAARIVAADPGRAERWCAVLLAARPADRSVRGSASVTSAQALYRLGRCPDAAAAARDALALLPKDAREARLAARTVLIDALMRLGKHDEVMQLAQADAGERGGDARQGGSRSSGPSARVVQGLREARILLLQERFGQALGVLGARRPEHRDHRAAVLAGVRLIAAISADATAFALLERRTHPAAPALPRRRLHAARDALRWGDILTAERALDAGGSAARRRPPAAFVRLSAAVTGLRTGDWASVLRAADEDAASEDGHPYVNEVLAALGAEVLVRWGRLEEAGERLRSLPGDKMFGHLVAWVRGGWQLASQDPVAAARTLSEAADRCARLGYLPGRDLLLSRLVDAQSASGNRADAEHSVDRLARVSQRIGASRATLSCLLRRSMLLRDARAAQQALDLAERQHDRFSLARAQLYAARLDDRDDGLLRSAYQSFEDLGAGEGPARTARTMRGPGVAARPADALTPRDRELVALIAVGATNAQAATAMHVTEKAIEVRLTRLYHRTGVRSRVELVRKFAGTGGKRPA
ncbi:AAA family ATPase [Streptomyces sp. NPDC059649]|uniref:helix-turn-helix transcriptional regulator n=1 Tax=Streptomyces sp. NPDC059649 TaxID=3346895 RepID=UPI0036C8EBA7